MLHRTVLLRFLIAGFLVFNAAMVVVGVREPASASFDVISVEQISVALVPRGPDSDASSPIVSSDGTIVTYQSEATNLVAGDTNERSDVFVHDRTTGITTLASDAADGSPSNGGSGAPSITFDGRAIAFQSDATNLVPGDTNNSSDVFVHDRATGMTMRVSVASDGEQGNESSDDPSISGDGTVVAFGSVADNLVGGRTIHGHVYLHDLATGSTSLVSVASDGSPGDRGARNPAVSDDGTIVVFESVSFNLTSDGIGGETHVYVHDRTTGSTSRVSVASDGTVSNGDSTDPAVSGDGTIVAFQSDADNLVPADNNGMWDTFVHDRTTGVTTRVSVAPDGTEANGGSQYWTALSADGTKVGYWSHASNLASGDTNEQADAFVYDRTTGTTTRVSVASDGTQGNSSSTYPALSGDGSVVAYTSWATNLVPGFAGEYLNVFVAELSESPPPSTTTTTTMALPEMMTIPLDTVVRGDPGAVKLIDPPGVVSVPADKVGSQCSVAAISENHSTHPNTDLIVTSGGSSVTLFDVEREGGERTDGDGLLTLGETFKIEVRLGADGVFSGGFVVAIVCEMVPPTTTTTTTAPDSGILVIPLDTVVRGDPDSVHLLTEAPIPVDKVGLRCSVQSTNNRSVHPDTNLIVSSDTSTVTLFDVERERHGATIGGAPLTLGDTATVEVQLGGDGVFSGGLFVGLCETQMSCANPALTIDVTPTYREVVVGGDARFKVTLTNNGDDAFSDVDVDATIDACDRDVGGLSVGAEISYRCKAEGVAVDLDVGFHAVAHGQDPGCVASDDATVRVVVELPPPTTTTTTTTMTTTGTPPTAATTTTTLPPAIPALPPPEPMTFVDDEDSIFEADIEWIAARGITRGCNPPANTRYCPDSYVTRGQMAAFLVRALGYTDDGGGNLFIDDNDSIFEGDIDRLGTAGVTKGCNPPTNNRYCPSGFVTRGQMAAFLVRALGYTDNGGGDLFIDDNDSIFETDIDRLGTAGVTKGCNPPTDNRYCPTGHVTRGQMAAFLHRALG